jgi:hypothetical protein
VSRGSRREAKDTYTKEKKDYFRCLYLDRGADNIEKYKMAKKATKRAISEAWGRA